MSRLAPPATSSGRPSGLAGFQDAFVRALLAGAPTRTVRAPGEPPDPAAAESRDRTAIERLCRQPGFAVYRNTVMTACIDALAANYPAVARLVGDEWFRAAATFFVRHAPPSQPCLFDYGEGFAGFFAGFPPAAALPYLPDVARLDRLWTEAHLAADEAPLDASRVAALTPTELANAVLAPHASARWAWFDRHPAWSLWRHGRADTHSEDGAMYEPVWQAEGALLVRVRGTVESMAASRAECAFLDACAAGQALAQCAAAALAADPDADLAASMARLLRAGAFARLEVTFSPEEPAK